MYTVIKYHKTKTGETSSLVKCDTYEEALKNYHQLAANYMADESALCWGLCIMDVSNGIMERKKKESYAKPLPPAPEPVLEAAEEVG